MSNNETEDNLVVRPVASSVASKSAQFCAGCGAKISGEASSCWRCGRFFQSRESGTWKVQNSFYRLPAMRAYRSAPPVRRIMAALVDAIFVLSIIAATELAAHALRFYGLATEIQVFTAVIAAAIFVPLIYFLVFDATALQGTPGKAIYDLKVTDLCDRPAAFSGTLRRFFAKAFFVIPALVFLAVVPLLGIHFSSFTVLLILVLEPLGHYSLDVALAFMLPENRTIIDHLSGTMVVRNDRR